MFKMSDNLVKYFKFTLTIQIFDIIQSIFSSFVSSRFPLQMPLSSFSNDIQIFSVQYPVPHNICGVLTIYDYHLSKQLLYDRNQES